jgi:hypothetical protein
MTLTEVGTLLSDLHSGDKTLDQVATAFRDYSWPDTEPSAQTYSSVSTAEQDDPEPLRAGTFDEVSVAYTVGLITDEQYAVLARAASGDADPKAPETKGILRHVRTAEGVTHYRQPIGSVITKDMIERAKRRKGKPKGGGHDLSGRGRSDGAGTVDDPIDVGGDIDRAVRLLGEGKHIRLNRPEDVGTLVHALYEVVKDAREKGDKAPKYDLCKVSVPKTNLFCGGNKGIPRVRMPQFAGVPEPRSRAAEIARKDPSRVRPDGKIDLTPEFKQFLTDSGIKVERRSVPLSHLRASQRELDGASVAAFQEKIDAGQRSRDVPILSARGGYIIDGHHRWASRVYEDIRDGKLEESMPTEVVDMDIGAVLDVASRFARDMGIVPRRVSSDSQEDDPSRTLPKLTPLPRPVERQRDHSLSSEEIEARAQVDENTRHDDYEDSRDYEDSPGPVRPPAPQIRPPRKFDPRLSSEENEMLSQIDDERRYDDYERDSEAHDPTPSYTPSYGARRPKEPPVPGRFADLDAVRAHLRTGGDRPGGKDADFLRKLADDPTLITSPGRSLVAIRSGRDWWISTAGSGRGINRMAEVSWGGKPAVLALMSDLETEIKDPDGKPFPWDDPNIETLARDWRSDRGENLGGATLRVTAEHDIAGGHPDTIAVGQYWRATHIGDTPSPPSGMQVTDKDEQHEFATVHWAAGTPVDVPASNGTTLPGVIVGSSAGGSVVIWSDGTYSVVDPKKLTARTDATGVEADPDVRYYLDETARRQAKLNADQAAAEEALQPHSPNRSRALGYQNDVRSDKIEARKIQGGLARAIAKVRSATKQKASTRDNSGSDTPEPITLPTPPTDIIPPAPEPTDPVRSFNAEDIVRLDDGRIANVVGVMSSGDVEVVVSDGARGSHLQVSPDRITETIFPPPPETTGTEGLAGLPLAVRGELTSAYEETGREYTVQPVAVTAAEHEWTGGSAFAVGGYRIRFNPRIADEAWRNESLGSTYTAATTMREAYLHEYAHAMTRRLELDDPAAAAELHRMFQSHIDRSREELYSQVETVRSVPESPDQLPDGIDPDGVLAMSHLVSGYGVESSEEGIAEAFVRGAQGRSNPYVDAVHEAFARYRRAGTSSPTVPPAPGETTDIAVEPPRRPTLVDLDGTTENVRAGDVAVGDRVLLYDHTDLRPATVTRIGTDTFGDFSMDYRFDGPGGQDEGEQSLALDPDEVLQRVSAEVGPITPDPLPERPDDALSAAVADVRPGDRLATDGGPGLLVISRRRDKATGLYEVTTIDEKGKRDSALYPASLSFELAKSGVDPDPLPEDTATARPVLATYQRKTIAALNLEESDNAVVAQAAIRVRDRMPLSVAQAAALSVEMRQRAGLEQRPVRKRSLTRVAAQLGATVTDLGGEFTPDQIEQNRVAKVTTADITEGDRIAIGVPDGIFTGKVVSIRPVMGGRLTQLMIEDETGTTRPVMLTRTAPAYRLPDLPDPVPVPVPEDLPAPERVREYSADRMAEIQGYLARDLDRNVRGEAMALATVAPEGRDGLEGVAGSLRNQRNRYRDGEAKTDGGALIAVLAPSLSLQDRRDLASITQTVTDNLRAEYYDRLAAGLADWPDDPSYTTRGILEQVLAATPPPDLTEVSRSLAVASHDLAQARREAIGYQPPDDDQKQAVKDSVTALFRAQRHEFAARLTDAVRGKSHSTIKAALTRLGNRENGVDPSADLVQQMMTQLSYGADPVNIPSVRERVRQQLRIGNERLRSRAVLEIELSGVNGRTRDPMEAIRISTDNLDNVQDGWSGADWFEATQLAEFAQIKLAEGGEGGRPVEVSAPSLPSPVAGQSLADRIGQLRAVLPQNGAGFGTRTFRTTTFGPTSLVALEQGHPPEIVSGETIRPDVDVTDSGPGEIAMRHLDVVKEAGRTLNEEVTRRMAERADQAPSYVPGHYDAAKSRTEEAWAAYVSAQKKHKDEVAKMYGYKSYAHMVKTRNALEMRQKIRPDDEELRKDFLFSTHGMRAAEIETEELKGMMDTYRTVYEEYRAAEVAEQPRNALFAQTVREVLSEVREMGTGDGASISFDLANDDEKTKAAHEAMRWAVEFYPRDWVRDNTQPIVLKSASRGYSKVFNEEGMPEIALSEKIDLLGIGGLRGRYSAVAVHELGHQMESRIPALVAAESAFLWSRTAVGPVGARERAGKNALSPIYAGSKQETGRKDRFQNHYSGKEYFGKSYELFTTGVEDIFGGHSEYIRNDEDYLHFMLGTLAVL